MKGTCSGDKEGDGDISLVMFLCVFIFLVLACSTADFEKCTGGKCKYDPVRN